MKYAPWIVSSYSRCTLFPFTLFPLWDYNSKIRLVVTSYFFRSSLAKCAMSGRTDSLWNSNGRFSYRLLCIRCFNSAFMATILVLWEHRDKKSNWSNSFVRSTFKFYSSSTKLPIRWLLIRISRWNYDELSKQNDVRRQTVHKGQIWS